MRRISEECIQARFTCRFSNRFEEQFKKRLEA